MRPASSTFAARCMIRRAAACSRSVDDGAGAAGVHGERARSRRRRAKADTPIRGTRAIALETQHFPDSPNQPAVSVDGLAARRGVPVARPSIGSSRVHRLTSISTSLNSPCDTLLSLDLRTWPRASSARRPDSRLARASRPPPYQNRVSSPFDARARDLVVAHDARGESRRR